MCGIIFTLNTSAYNSKLDDWFRDALMASQVRGLHSSGIYQISSTGVLYDYKKACPATTFLEDNVTNGIVNRVNSSPITVGHVRHATVGAKNDDNAHPFVVKRDDGTVLVGVHNGTLRNWKLKEGSNDYDVDSAWAFQKLADEGTAAFRYFNGAFAFVWYDSRTPNILYCARNEERSLFFMRADDGKTLLGASELGLLGWTADRNGYKLSSKPKADGYLYFTPGKVFQLSAETLEVVSTEKFPDYDPKTTVAAPVTHHAMVRYTPTTAAYHYDEQDWDYHSDVPFRNDYYSGGKSSEAILQRVTKILRAARNLEPSKQQQEEQDAIAEEINQLISEEPTTYCEATFSSHPDISTATTGEQEQAKALGVFGMVVDFSGAFYDEGTNSCIGNVSIDFNGKSSHDGDVRGLSARAAEAAYINTLQPRKMTVVGYYEFQGDPNFVLSELTESARKLVDFKTNKRRRAN